MAFILVIYCPKDIWACWCHNGNNLELAIGGRGLKVLFDCFTSRNDSKLYTQYGLILYARRKAGNLKVLVVEFCMSVDDKRVHVTIIK